VHDAWCWRRTRPDTVPKPFNSEPLDRAAPTTLPSYYYLFGPTSIFNTSDPLAQLTQPSPIQTATFRRTPVKHSNNCSSPSLCPILLYTSNRRVSLGLKQTPFDIKLLRHLQPSQPIRAKPPLPVSTSGKSSMAASAYGHQIASHLPGHRPAVAAVPNIPPGTFPSGTAITVGAHKCIIERYLSEGMSHVLAAATTAGNARS
jgi:hypothetical protein